MDKKRFLYFFLAIIFLGGLVFWILRIPPDSWRQILGFFTLIFLFSFFLSLGIWGRPKIALWLASWVVLGLFLRLKRVSLFLFALLSLLLWAVIKITP